MGGQECGKPPFSCFVRALEQGDSGLQDREGPCCLSVLNPRLDMAPSPCLHSSPSGVPHKTGTWLGAPSVVTGVGWYAVTSWGNRGRAGLGGDSACWAALPPCPTSNTVTLVSPCGFSFFPFQFFRAFSKKAEDGIRITSEYSEPRGFLTPGVNGRAAHTPCVLGPQGAQAGSSELLPSAQPVGPASPGLIPWHPVPLQIPVPLLRTCAMLSSPTLSRARTPGRPPVLRWSQQGRDGMTGRWLWSPCHGEQVSGEILSQKWA